MSTIAITGASGYIGAHLAGALKAEGHRIIAMARAPVPQADAFIPFTLGGMNDYTGLAGADRLIHCAYDFTCIGERDIRRVNCNGSAELLVAAKAQGVKRIVYFSTVSAFEGAVSDYGRLKFETEQAAHAAGALVVRPGLVFSKNPGGMVRALSKLTQTLPCLPVVGMGNQRFYPCHVADLCSLVQYVIANDIQEIAPIVAACEQPVTFKQIIHILARSQGRHIVTVPVPYALMYAGLKVAELLHVKTGLRSDSLKYMKHINPDMDFSFAGKAGIAFRPFTAETLSS